MQHMAEEAERAKDDAYHEARDADYRAQSAE